MSNENAGFRLFIPRKQNFVASVIGTSTWVDPSHLEKVLRDNFLAVQNWANRRATSCSVRSASTVDTILNNTFTQLSFDTKTWDYSTIGSTSAQTITIPEPGIYFISAGVNVTNIPGQTHMELILSPGNYPAQHGFLSGSTAGSWTMSWGGNAQQFRQSQVGTALTIQFLAAMPSTGDVCNAQLAEFTVTKFADIPAKIQ